MCLLFGVFFVGVILAEGELWGEEGGRVFISIMIFLSSQTAEFILSSREGLDPRGFNN